MTGIWRALMRSAATVVSANIMSKRAALITSIAVSATVSYIAAATLVVSAATVSAATTTSSIMGRFQRCHWKKNDS